MKKYLPFTILLSIVSVTIVFLSAQKQQAAQTTVPENPVIPTDIIPETSMTPAVYDSMIAPSAKEISLTVSEPLPYAVVTSPSVTVRGVTSPNADVFINEMETVADNMGAFRVNLPLEEGENYIVIVANDESGLSAETEISVTYQIPQM